MRQWEYGILTERNTVANGRVVSTELTWNGEPVESPVRQCMNDLGRQGWELTTSTSIVEFHFPYTDFEWIFKRPLG